MAPLWALHISDGVLTTPWLAGGFVGMVLLMMAACYRVNEEEIPRIALLTAAFFVASLIHIRLGPTSVHLLLNGLVGVILGLRAGLAIPIGLFLQATLFGHGGISTLGVNSCVQGLPALVAGGLFRLLIRFPATRQPWFRFCLIAVASMAFLFCLTLSLTLLATGWPRSFEEFRNGYALQITLQPIILISGVLLSLATAWMERREDHGTEFSLGLALGMFTVLATLVLASVALVAGGEEKWEKIVLLIFVAHLPVAAIEGVVTGFTVNFLVRVKPELLGVRTCTATVQDVPSNESIADTFTTP